MAGEGERFPVKPPGKTTLNRMQQTALIEMERIEITQDHWLSVGRIKAPVPEQLERRDDFAGIVRLIDAIMSDQVLLERLGQVQKRMAQLPAPATTPADEEAAEQ
jgi:hypothetical protein